MLCRRTWKSSEVTSFDKNGRSERCTNHLDGSYSPPIASPHYASSSPYYYYGHLHWNHCGLSREFEYRVDALFRRHFNRRCCGVILASQRSPRRGGKARGSCHVAPP